MLTELTVNLPPTIVNEKIDNNYDDVNALSLSSFKNLLKSCCFDRFVTLGQIILTLI